MELAFIRNKQEFSAHISGTYGIRMSVEKFISECFSEAASWDLIGYCDYCKQPTKFNMDWFNSYDHPVFGKMPSYRERMVCSICGLNNRQRFMASYLTLCARNSQDPTVYIQEQVTPFFKAVTDLPNCQIIGSEYLGPEFKPGEIVKNIRHEDALALSFADQTFDILCSNDVFEHVPDIEKAFSEAFRILKLQGKLLFSVPFLTTEMTSAKRAELLNGKVRYLAPERYHGNPVSANGSLVFYDVGWDILDKCKQAGFSDCYLLGYYSLMHGYIGNGIQYLFVAEKDHKII